MQVVAAFCRHHAGFQILWTSQGYVIDEIGQHPVNNTDVRTTAAPHYMPLSTETGLGNRLREQSMSGSSNPPGARYPYRGEQHDSTLSCSSSSMVSHRDPETKAIEPTPAE